MELVGALRQETINAVTQQTSFELQVFRQESSGNNSNNNVDNKHR